MNQFKVILSLTCFLLLGLNSFAQLDLSPCERLVQRRKVAKAIECYETAIAKEPKNIKVLCRLSELHYENQEKEKSKQYAKQAVDTDADAAYNPIYYIAQKMSFRRDNVTAIYMLDLLGNRISDKQKKQKLGALKSSYLLQKYELNQPHYNVELLNLGDSINSADAEYLPSLSLDGNTMVFTRRINGANEDFFIAEKDTNDVWGLAKNLGYPPNTGFPDGAATLSADGNYLFFTRCDMRSPNGIESGGCDLVFCYRNGRENGQIIWSAPQYFQFTINTVAYEGQPCLSSDNKDLYFVSDREGGYGGKDIYVSHFEDNFWSIPENLGPLINTAKDETTPFIHPDNETLYFASNGHPTLGETDVFVSRKMGRENWKEVVNLGSPINTDKIDGGVAVSANGRVGYIASERAGSRGLLDIYSFELYEGIRPIPTLCTKGQVMDKKTGELFKEQKINFYNSPTNAFKNELISNKGDASYTQALHIGKQFMMTVERAGYRPYYKIFDLRKDTFPDNLYKNIRLRTPGITDSLGTFWLELDTVNMVRKIAPLADSIKINPVLNDSLIQKNDSVVNSKKRQLSDAGQQILNNIKSKMMGWLEDSARVKMTIETAYYYGDYDADSIGSLEFFDARLDLINKILMEFEAFDLPKDKIQITTKSFIWRDEAAENNYIKMWFVEDY